MRNRAMSSTVATVFLVMITMAALAILWGVIFPFIQNELDVENLDVRLDLVTEKGFTVYDPASQFAMIQVRRGTDDATLKGMEIFMDMDGTGYKTTLRAPDAGGLRRYVFNMSDLSPKGPGYTSVAPIIAERGRSFVGSVTSRLFMPYATIAVDIQELVLSIEQDGDADTFVIVLNESVSEVDYSTCPQGETEDPWSGCAVYNGMLTNITDGGFSADWAYLTGTLSDDWETGNHWILFNHAGSGSVCLTSSRTSCLAVPVDSVDPVSGFINMGSQAELTVENCIADRYYVYDNGDCE